MSQSTSVLKSVSWRDLCPWLILAKSIGVALRPSIVFIAFVGLLITPIGWSVAEFVLAEGDQQGNEFPLDQQDSMIKVRTQIATEKFWVDTFNPNEWYAGQGPLQIFGKFYKGHLQLLNPIMNIRQCTYYFLGSVWMLLVWSVLGAMICRIAAMQFTRDERVGVIDALDFVRRRLTSIWTSSFVPLGLIMLFAIPFFLVGLLMKANFLVMLVGIGWFMVAMIGLAMAVILIPLFFGFPLLWPSIATEGSDAFESISRSYSYPTQKPYQYVFYWLVILVIGFLAAFVASILASKTIEFTRWGTSWGAGTERVIEIEMASQAPSSTTGGGESSSFSTLGAGSQSIRFWEKGIRILTVGFNYGFFFVAMTGLYLLMRKDNDFMELDEIHIDEEEDVLPLPQIKTSDPELPNQLKDPGENPAATLPPAEDVSDTPPESSDQPDDTEDKLKSLNNGDAGDGNIGEEFAGDDGNEDDGELRVENE